MPGCKFSWKLGGGEIGNGGGGGEIGNVQSTAPFFDKLKFSLTL